MGLGDPAVMRAPCKKNLVWHKTTMKKVTISQKRDRRRIWPQLSCFSRIEIRRRLKLTKIRAAAADASRMANSATPWFLATNAQYKLPIQATIASDRIRKH